MDEQTQDQTMCTTCGMSLTAEGKCEGCHNEPAECTCKQDASNPSEEAAA